MKKSYLLLFLAGTALMLSAQPGHRVTAAQKHDQWMEQLSRQPVPLQKKMIAERLLADTVSVAVRPYCLTGLSAREQEAERLKQTPEAPSNRSEDLRMPLMLVEGCPVPGDYYEPRPATAVRSLAVLIRKTSFERITIVTGAKATALYGAFAANGVLIMELKDKKAASAI